RRIHRRGLLDRKVDRLRYRHACGHRRRPVVRGERLFARDRRGTLDARRQGRADLRGHEPDPPDDRRRRDPALTRCRFGGMTQASTGPNGHVYLVSAARTPIGKFGGALAGVPATELGGIAIRAAVERAGLDPATAVIDDVLMGQVLQAGAGQAPARQAVLKAGLPDTPSATTITRVCGSGLKAIMLAPAATPA